MAITDPILLSPDVVLVPVADLAEEVRRKIDPRATGTGPSPIPGRGRPRACVDAGSAELLAEFRTPRTIVDAVIRYSQAREPIPEAVLEEAYPLLGAPALGGLPGDGGLGGAAGIGPPWSPGTEIAGFEVLELRPDAGGHRGLPGTRTRDAGRRL